ncbi:unnamed protein product [Notodromas monacha]|uniref:Uncharacterized protein n=1 Tax=Notodromas monacha TaxID=399045 RepID=A0A7R9GJE6_9CRUS|nr:unnamed protein product [Notodromas monacha]CAG0922764.1 unnamed protein product [Notodromas monacha]
MDGKQVLTGVLVGVLLCLTLADFIGYFLHAGLYLLSACAFHQFSGLWLSLDDDHHRNNADDDGRRAWGSSRRRYSLGHMNNNNNNNGTGYYSTSGGGVVGRDGHHQSATTRDSSNWAGSLFCAAVMTGLGCVIYARPVVEWFNSLVNFSDDFLTFSSATSEGTASSEIVPWDTAEESFSVHDPHRRGQQPATSNLLALAPGDGSTPFRNIDVSVPDRHHGRTVQSRFSVRRDSLIKRMNNPITVKDHLLQELLSINKKAGENQNLEETLEKNSSLDENSRKSSSPFFEFTTSFASAELTSSGQNKKELQNSASHVSEAVHRHTSGGVHEDFNNVSSLMQEATALTNTNHQDNNDNYSITDAGNIANGVCRACKAHHQPPPDTVTDFTSPYCGCDDRTEASLHIIQLPKSAAGISHQQDTTCSSITASWSSSSVSCSICSVAAARIRAGRRHKRSIHDKRSRSGSISASTSSTSRSTSTVKVDSTLEDLLSQQSSAEDISSSKAEDIPHQQDKQLPAHEEQAPSVKEPPKLSVEAPKEQLQNPVRRRSNSSTVKPPANNNNNNNKKTFPKRRSLSFHHLTKKEEEELISAVLQILRREDYVKSSGSNSSIEFKLGQLTTPDTVADAYTSTEENNKSSKRSLFNPAHFKRPKKLKSTGVSRDHRATKLYKRLVKDSIKFRNLQRDMKRLASSKDNKREIKASINRHQHLSPAVSVSHEKPTPPPPPPPKTLADESKPISHDIIKSNKSTNSSSSRRRSHVNKRKKMSNKSLPPAPSTKKKSPRESIKSATVLRVSEPPKFRHKMPSDFKLRPRRSLKSDYLFLPQENLPPGWPPWQPLSSKIRTVNVQPKALPEKLFKEPAPPSTISKSRGVQTEPKIGKVIERISTRATSSKSSASSHYEIAPFVPQVLPNNSISTLRNNDRLKGVMILRRIRRKHPRSSSASSILNNNNNNSSRSSKRRSTNNPSKPRFVRTTPEFRQKLKRRKNVLRKRSSHHHHGSRKVSHSSSITHWNPMHEPPVKYTSFSQFLAVRQQREIYSNLMKRPFSSNSKYYSGSRKATSHSEPRHISSRKSHRRTGSKRRSNNSATTIRTSRSTPVFGPLRRSKTGESVPARVSAAGNKQQSVWLTSVHPSIKNIEKPRVETKVHMTALDALAGTAFGIGNKQVTHHHLASRSSKSTQHHQQYIIKSKLTRRHSFVPPVASEFETEEDISDHLKTKLASGSSDGQIIRRRRQCARDSCSSEIVITLSPHEPREIPRIFHVTPSSTSDVGNDVTGDIERTASGEQSNSSVWHFAEQLHKFFDSMSGMEASAVPVPMVVGDSHQEGIQPSKPVTSSQEAETINDSWHPVDQATSSLSTLAGTVMVPFRTIFDQLQSQTHEVVMPPAPAEATLDPTSAMPSADGLDGLTDDQDSNQSMDTAELIETNSFSYHMVSTGTNPVHIMKEQEGPSSEDDTKVSQPSELSAPNVKVVQDSAEGHYLKDMLMSQTRGNNANNTRRSLDLTRAQRLKVAHLSRGNRYQTPGPTVVSPWKQSSRPAEHRRLLASQQTAVHLLDVNFSSHSGPEHNEDEENKQQQRQQKRSSPETRKIIGALLPYSPPKKPQLTLRSSSRPHVRRNLNHSSIRQRRSMMQNNTHHQSIIDDGDDDERNFASKNPSAPVLTTTISSRRRVSAVGKNKFALGHSLGTTAISNANQFHKVKSMTPSPNTGSASAKRPPTARRQ